MRAHLSVPIRLSDGHVFGTLCCFSRHPDETLPEHDVATMRVLADVMADYFEHELATGRRPRSSPDISPAEVGSLVRERVVIGI